MFRDQDAPGQNLALFLMTGLSVFWIYATSWVDPALPKPERVGDGLLFAVPLMLILLAHELGHYLMARAHGVDTSLPWFIPVPFGFGTLGAVIRLRGKIPDRNALVDIGAAGPLAGLLVAVPMLVVGLMHAHVGPAPEHGPLFPGQLSLWAIARDLLSDGASPDMARMYFGDNLLTWATQRLVLGELPPGTDVYAGPVFLAAWFGLLVTMLNLMPVGQLDGGHLTHAWFGARAVSLGRLVAVALGVLAVVGAVSWLVWLLVAWKVVRFEHPPVEQPEVPLTIGRKVVCVVSFVCFLLTVMPVPLELAP